MIFIKYTPKGHGLLQGIFALSVLWFGVLKVCLYT